MQNLIVRFALTILVLATGFIGSAVAADFTLDGPKSCAALGGTWTSVGESPPQIGRCVLDEPFTLRFEDRLYVSGGVVLALNAPNNYISGNLYVSTTAVLRLLASTRVTGVVDIANGGELQLWGGWLDNAGLIQSEGYFEIYPNLYFYNTGTLRNFGGGEVDNSGTVLMYKQLGDCWIRNEAGGTIVNKHELYVVHPCGLINDDLLENKASAALNINGELYNQNGGVLSNRGWFDVSSGHVVNQDSSIENRGSGKIWAYGTSRFSNQQSATITNHDTGKIQISAPAILYNSSAAQLINHNNTELFIDDGTVNNNAMIVNNGKIVNDTSNNSTVGQFNNNAGGYLDNGTSGKVLNTFGYFNNRGGATVNNGGEFWVCFGRYQAGGVFMGNAIQFCFPRPNFPTRPTFPLKP